MGVKIKITPVSKPRQTRSDVWKERPAVMRYRAFADELRLKYSEDLPPSVSLVFHLPMPKSWSKKRREAMRYRPHQQKPDIDNLSKAVLDALLEDDCAVWHLDAYKFWADEGAIEIDPHETEW
jgi:Holliday junction resolvase RusA-like endonuclease